MEVSGASSAAHVGRRVAYGFPIAVWMMLGNTFVMNVGFFMLIPLVSVHYTTALGFSAASVGLSLAVRQFTQQGLMLATGSLSERIGYRPVLIAGLLVRSAGFASFAVAETLPRLLVACVIAALGGALFEVTSRALVTVLTPEERRADSFSLWSLISNVGLAVGPLVGALLIGIGFGAVCLAAASIYLVGATGTWLLVPPSDVRGRVSRPPSLLRTIGIVTRDRNFVLFTIAMAGYYVLATQLFITIPLETERLTGSTNSLGLVYLTNSIIAVALQFPLVRFTSRRFSNLVTITIGTVLIGTGLLSVAGAGGLVWLLGSVVIIALGRVLIDPTMNMSIASVASRAGDGLLASYFGFSALSVAIGGAAGQLLGGWLYDRAENSNVHALPWLVMGAVAVVVSLALLSLSRTAAAQQLDSRRA